MHAVVRYRGVRTPAGSDVVRVHADGSASLLRPRHDLCNYGPFGFEWGRRGPGASQLALALLADATGDYAVAEGLH
jgi:hypothetical protein